MQNNPKAAIEARPEGSAPQAPSPAQSARAAPESPAPVEEIGGPAGPEPTRFGDWEKNGRCIDF